MTSSQAQSRHRGEAPVSAVSGGGNIVLFSPRRASAAPPIALGPDDRPAPWSPSGDAHRLFPLFLLCAVALHAGLYALDREPAPVASIGEVSISVDILLGSQVTAGPAATPGPSAVASSASKETEQPAKAEPPEPERAQAAVQPPKAEPAEPERAQTAVQPPNGEPSEPERAQAAVQPQMTAPEPERPLKTEPVTAPRQPGAAVSSPATRPIERKPPIARPPPGKSREPRAKAQREARRQPAESAAPSSAASTPSSGTGPGRSDADSNYRGLVFAHLARHQQFPPEARARGDQGSTQVMFSIDGSGRVLSVRLTRSSGVASFDQETQAMVRRASPFPSPPGGRPMTLSAPVSFRLR